MKPVGASAPGKALLCGEYAVLDGAPAVVSAVGRRVSVAWTQAPVSMPPEVEATLALAQRRCGPVPGALTLDVSALQQDRVKLGLGSSAAAAAASAGAVFATHGFELSEPSVTRRVFDCALEGHASIAPQGSGVDVAASTLGGFVRFSRIGDEVQADSLPCPDGLLIRLVWTGHAARTSELVAKVRELEGARSSVYRACMRSLHELASAFASAFERGDAHEVLEQADAYSKAMAALGDAAGAPIVEAQLARAGALAASCSGSAKPCGAGGGDVAIAFFTDPDAARRFEVACRDEQLHPIEVSWGATGVRTP